MTKYIDRHIVVLSAILFPMMAVITMKLSLWWAAAAIVAVVVFLQPMLLTRYLDASTHQRGHYLLMNEAFLVAICGLVAFARMYAWPS